MNPNLTGDGKEQTYCHSLGAKSRQQDLRVQCNMVITHSRETAGALPRWDQFPGVPCAKWWGRRVLHTIYTASEEPGVKGTALFEQEVNTAARNKLIPLPGGTSSYVVVTLGYPFIIFSVRRWRSLEVWHSQQEHIGCSGPGVGSVSQQEVFISVYWMNK